MKYLYIKSEHYKMFVKENNTNKLSKNLKLWTRENKLKKFIDIQINEEQIFENPIETKYKIEIDEYIADGFVKRKKIVFATESGNEYRIDINTLFEEDKMQLGQVSHISFSINDPALDEIPMTEEDYIKFDEIYSKLTNRGETLEILNRIHFILRDLVDKGNLYNSFCVGISEIESKNKIYEYFLEKIVGKNGFKKLKTDIYPVSKYGIYFKI
jgi:hypothetical protein